MDLKFQNVLYVSLAIFLFAAPQMMKFKSFLPHTSSQNLAAQPEPQKPLKAAALQASKTHSSRTPASALPASKLQPAEMAELNPADSNENQKSTSD